MSKSVEFKDYYPPVPSYSDMMMLQGMTYKVKLRLDPDINVTPSQVLVQAWTSQCDRHSPGGQWHAVDLAYIGCLNNTHEYGQTVVITSDKDFEFTFRLRIPGIMDGDKWMWSHEFGCNGHAHVDPPRDKDKWTQGPDYSHILGSVHLGNFIAATHAKQCGFTHVLNVADNLDMVYPEGGVKYHKVPMKDGGHNPIEEYKIKEAVDWLQKQNKEGNKVLVNCRAGIGRAGSTAVAFVFAENPEMSYKEAYKFCFSKRFVYPHVGLKDILHSCFPRK